MSLPLVLRPEAEEDLRQASEHLERSQLGLGRRLVADAGEIFQRIETQPELYGRVWQDVRAARLKKFRYVVYYVVFADRIEVLAVLHGSRDPSVLPYSSSE